MKTQKIKTNKSLIQKKQGIVSPPETMCCPVQEARHIVYLLRKAMLADHNKLEIALDEEDLHTSAWQAITMNKRAAALMIALNKLSAVQAAQLTKPDGAQLH